MNKLLSFSSWSFRDTLFFTKRLVFCLHAGMPLAQGLRVINKQYAVGYKYTTHRTVLSSFLSAVESGKSLSYAMSLYKQIFGEFAIAIVALGERSGTLESNLVFLTEQFTKQYRLRRKVVASLLYPILILIFSLGLVMVLLGYVLPKILPIFDAFKFELPWSTKVVINMYQIFFQHQALCIISLMLSSVIFFFIIKFKIGRRYWDKIFLRIPFFGKLFRVYNQSTFCRSLGLLLASGTPVLSAIDITGTTLHSLEYRNVMGVVTQKLKEGLSVARSLQEFPNYFPILMIHTLEVAEASGSLVVALGFLNDMFEQEIVEKTNHLSSSIEPILMIIMGVVVSFIALAIITPIYGITNAIHP